MKISPTDSPFQGYMGSTIDLTDNGRDNLDFLNPSKIVSSTKKSNSLLRKNENKINNISRPADQYQ